MFIGSNGFISSHEPGLFEAAERSRDVAFREVVDGDDAGLDLGEQLLNRVQVIGPDGCLQSVLGVIGHGDTFFQRIECFDGEDRSENLLADDPHGLVAVVEDARLDEVSAGFLQDLLATVDQISAFVLSDFDVVQDLLHMRLFDDGAVAIGWIQRIADFPGFYFF